VADDSPELVRYSSDGRPADLDDLGADAGSDTGSPDVQVDTLPPDTLPPDTLPPDTLPPDTLPPDTDPCAGVVCNDPPDDECTNSWTVRHYESPGKCSAGKCSYSYYDEWCTDWCTWGECEGGGK
jgi:hypothetical protein